VKLMKETCLVSFGSSLDLFVLSSVKTGGHDDQISLLIGHCL